MSRALWMVGVLGCFGCSKSIVFLDNVGEDVSGAPQWFDMGKAPKEDVVRSPYVLGAQTRLRVWARSGYNNLDAWSLESSDPEVVSVGERVDTSDDDSEFMEWALTAEGVGEAEIRAVDSRGEVADTVTLTVASPDSIRLVPTGASRVGRSDIEVSDPVVVASGSVTVEFYEGEERLWGGLDNSAIVVTDAEVDPENPAPSLYGLTAPVYHESVSRNDFTISYVDGATDTAAAEGTVSASLYTLEGEPVFELSAPLSVSPGAEGVIADVELLVSDEGSAVKRQVMGVYPHATTESGEIVLGATVSWQADDLEIGDGTTGQTDFLEYNYDESEELEILATWPGGSTSTTIHGENPRAVVSSAACQTGPGVGGLMALSSAVTLLIRRRRR